MVLRNVTGGRGGIVYHVTKLDKNYSDTGPGTLRYGLTDSNFSGAARTIVFDVSGTFWLGRYGAEKGHDNGWDTQSRYNLGSNITIAGQTAPGPVYIMGGVVKANGSNTILRNVTVAPGYGMRNFSKPEDGVYPTPGDFPDSYLYDAIDVSGQNQMIDHVSTMYATDEHISCNEATRNLTVQYSNISQGQNYPQWDAEGGGYTGHALGSLLSGGDAASAAAITFHHNLYAHQKGRVPQVGSISGSQGGYFDFRNNVFYNWLGTAGTKGGTTSLNLVNNFYLAGPGGDNPVGGTSTGITTASGGTGVLGTSSTVYRNGNLLDSNKDGDANDGAALSAGGASGALWMNGTNTYLGTTDSALAAYNRVLNYMGANWWTRDGVVNTPDERIINETRTGTGKIVAWADDPFNTDSAEGTEWRQMLSYRADPTTGAAPYNRAANWDTDQDGMPDAWEAKHGLNPAVANNNADFDSDGYTDLEEYINDLAAWPAAETIVFNGATNSRYAQITNWDANATAGVIDNWQPSRYDTAKINSAGVVVDSVGQQAGTLLVGNDAGSSGGLIVSSGWIEVGTLRVGSASGSTGTLNLTGGEMRVGALVRIQSTGSVQFGGGKLAIGNSGIVDYAGSSPLATLRLQLALGMTAGTGIVPSGNALPGQAIGSAEASALGLTNFAGEGVDSTTVLLKLTWLGDANLDSNVNFADLLILAANYGNIGVWTSGDFNYDDTVNFTDLLLLAANYGQPVTGSLEGDWALALSIVPEPGTSGAVGVAGLFGLRRARRMRR
ncbi:MAG: hypothetical protein QM770_17205 [Tepidisphaeraceae bacterium]